ncbi:MULTISPECIES: TetR/AcrR family transcriptional regulator [Kitasatospora]|uniref:Putative TetR family transcriptional regulator n=1 Tax=Kitasatospora setae (strain ATCC 33774 / DSM 43861 / JCM 3304 / KCC A-0304 / NBRC 14216 / KM-6054) TaxID=452652 RepID=E4NE77_KITSK|nr:MULTISPECIES: TetR/AcrR family transcriptional regulator [Kitasatospora]BAJ29508.1 putative TetR family transcriptional regulator [Kitasatospora setae KM-6054]
MVAEPDARVPRADARRNRERLLEVGAHLLAEQGAGASLRDVARRAGVGLGTLYRHFPTREALLEALLARRFGQLTELGGELAAAGGDPEAALVDWLREFCAGAGAYQGLPEALVATLRDPASPLHASCAAMREAGGGLLAAAQRTGRIRADVTGTDLFALVSAVSWIGGQAPALAERREHLFGVVVDGLRA